MSLQLLFEVPGCSAALGLVLVLDTTSCSRGRAGRVTEMGFTGVRVWMRE